MVSNTLLKQLWTVAPPAFDSGQRPWELGLPAICRAPAVESDGAAGQVHRVHRLCRRFAPDRRQANSHALRAEAGEHLTAARRSNRPMLRRLLLILAAGRGSRLSGQCGVLAHTELS